MHWIFSSSQLPQEAGSFIVSTENGVGMARYNKGLGFHQIILTGNMQCTSQTVFAWMPFPEQPFVQPS